jgi:hypothetical protein
MIKTACASNFNKKNGRPPDSDTVILITVSRPYPWLDYDEWIRVLGPSRDIKDRWFASKRTEVDSEIYWRNSYPR